jgi:hypothetical protein
LGKLLEIAKGSEKNPILEQLGWLMGYPKGQLPEQVAVTELRKMERYLPLKPLAAQVTGSVVAASSDSFRATRPQLAALVDAVRDLCDLQREVDESLVRILHLWIAHDDQDPVVRECFADAVKYLEVALTAKAAAKKERRRTA